MDLELSDEQQLIRKTAREWVDKEVVPRARDSDRAERLDPELVRQLGELGFLGAVIPELYGGMGLDNLSYCLIVEELGRGDSSVRGVVSVNVGLVGKTLYRFGTEDQKRAWLTPLAAGEILGCFGLTEPGVGSDAAALTSRAERDGGDWLISGQKQFISNGNDAAVALVFARTGGEGQKGITCFLVPTDVPGFSSRPVKGKLGLRAQDTAELFLDR